MNKKLLIKEENIEEVDLLNKKSEKEVEKRIRKKLTPYEWRKLREKIKFEYLTAFQKEFRKQLATFITGAFAFVAALLWRDAIKSFVEKYQNLIKEIMPLKEVWVIQFFTAFAVSIIAVIAIIVISKVLGVEKK